MKLLVIPSWFPHRCFPFEGMYILDQARAIADLRPDWKVGISLWGQGAGFVSRSHLKPACWRDALLSDLTEARKEPWPRNLRAFVSPSLTWSFKVLGGHRVDLLNKNSDNLEMARIGFAGVDLIHAHGSYPAGWLAMKLSQKHGIPFVVTEHMGPFPLPVYREHDATTLRPELREPLERAHARIAVSPALADSIAAFGIARPEYVPNVFDDRNYQISPPASPAHFTFFTLCGMERAKGVDDLLNAIARLLPTLSAEARARVRFRLGGEGPEFANLRALATRLGLDAHVTWLGLVPREQARIEFLGCDAFVLASHHESFGIVFVEAMACGKPVIATRCGGPESIVTADTGVLVGVKDVAALSAALGAMVRRERAWDARRIRAEFDARYARSAVVDRLESIYRDVFARAPVPASYAAGTGHH